MLINIIDVGQPNTHAAKNGRNYQSIEVTYKAENGQVANKKLMSFSNPSVFNHIKGLAKGDTLNVTTTKDANGYWQWTGIEGEGTATESKPTGGTVGTTNRVTGSNYETKEERAARQILIVRQSSLASAVELLGPGKSVDDVLKVARQFETYVFAREEAPEVTQDEDDNLV